MHACTVDHRSRETPAQTEPEAVNCGLGSGEQHLGDFTRDFSMVATDLEAQRRQFSQHPNALFPTHPAGDQGKYSSTELASFHLGSGQLVSIARHFAFVSRLYGRQRERHYTSCFLVESSHLAAIVQIAS